MCLDHIRGGVYLIDSSDYYKDEELSTYIILGEKAMIIDPGPYSSINKKILCLKKSNIQNITYVSLTHIHLDHGGGSWKLLNDYPATKIFVHPKGTPHIIDPTRLVASARKLLGNRVDAYGEIREVASSKIRETRDGEMLDLGGMKVKVIWTPGHASHHQSFFLPEEETLILGDAAGIYDKEKGIILPTTPPPFNPPKALESLDRLISLDPEIVCYSHIGYSYDGVKKLKDHKKQIQLWSSTVERGLEENLSLKEIYNWIITNDPMVNNTKRVISDIRERSPLITLQGFIEYHNWKNSKE